MASNHNNQDIKSSVNERTYQEVEYLKKNLGPILVAALAEICIRRPSDPIEYLGHWLLRWRYNEELKRRDVQNALEVVREKQWTQAQHEGSKVGVPHPHSGNGGHEEHQRKPSGEAQSTATVTGMLANGSPASNNAIVEQLIVGHLEAALASEPLRPGEGQYHNSGIVHHHDHEHEQHDHGHGHEHAPEQHGQHPHEDAEHHHPGQHPSQEHHSGQHLSPSQQEHHLGEHHEQQHEHHDPAGALHHDQQHHGQEHHEKGSHEHDILAEPQPQHEVFATEFNGPLEEEPYNLPDTLGFSAKSLQGEEGTGSQKSVGGAGVAGHEHEQEGRRHSGGQPPHLGEEPAGQHAPRKSVGQPPHPHEEPAHNGEEPRRTSGAGQKKLSNAGAEGQEHHNLEEKTPSELEKEKKKKAAANHKP